MNQYTEEEDIVLKLYSNYNNLEIKDEDFEIFRLFSLKLSKYF